MKITEHVYFYQTPENKDLIKSSNTVVIVGKNKQIMIDPGVDLRNRWKWLIKEMKKDGLTVERTNEVWLTHHHFDHSCLIEKMSKFGVKVRAHYLAKKVLEAKSPSRALEFQQIKAGGKLWSINLLGLTELSKVLSEIKAFTKLATLKPIKIDQSFFWEEKVLIEPMEVYVLSLAGHCPDEIGFWIPKEEVLIIGDLIHPSNNGRTFFPVLNNFLSDLDQAIDSIEKMRRIKKWKFRFFPKILRPQILLPAHGDPIIGKKNIQKLFGNVLFEIKNFKKITKDFVQKKVIKDKISLIEGISLINKLARLFAEWIVEKPSSALICEMRFTAFVVLKNLGVIK